MRNDEMTINYLKQKARQRYCQGLGPDYAYQPGQEYNYNIVENGGQLYAVKAEELSKFNEQNQYSSPFHPSKRLSFSNVPNLPSVQDFDPHLVKQILGPSPRSSFGSANRIYENTTGYMGEGFYEEDKENYLYNIPNAQYKNTRKSVDYYPNLNNQQILYRTIQSRNTVPHINTPIKPFTRVQPNVEENVPFFLQERKITHLR